MRALVVSTWSLSLGLIAASAACTVEESPTPSEQIGQPIISGTLDDSTANDAVVQLSSNQGRCTGTIFQKSATYTWILTAAHCVPTSTVSIGFNGQSPSATYQVEAYAMDERYGDGEGMFSLYYDVALVRVEGSIPNVVPIQLADANDGLTPNTSVTSYGYGSTTGYNTGNNRRRYSIARNIAELDANVIVYDQSDNKGICAGDSGGPVVLGTGSNRRVVGVHSTVSNTPGQEQCFGQANSMRVSARRDFIDAVLNGTARPGLNACQTCLETSDNSSACQQKRQRCQSDSDCSSLRSCINNGGGVACLDQHPRGVGPYIDFLDCGCSDTCGSQCGGDQFCSTSAKCGVAFNSATYTTCVQNNCCAEADAAAADGLGYICLGDPNASGCSTSEKYQAFVSCTAENCERRGSSSSSGGSSSSSSGSEEPTEEEGDDDGDDESSSSSSSSGTSKKKAKDEGGCAVAAVGADDSPFPAGAGALFGLGLIAAARRKRNAH